MIKILLGFILALLLVPLAAWIYLSFGSPPVAVGDPPFPMERQIVHIPLNNRIDQDKPQTVPLQADDATFEAGAHIYRQNCADCHGLPGRPSVFAAHMYPSAPPLWKSHRPGVVGVSDDSPGETYWKVDNGIRLTGMPAFNKVLSQTQIWQVTLLLANANKPMSSTVESVLQQPLTMDVAGTPAVPAAPATPQHDRK
jgi:mono/diheme cytochrome c family protein